MKSNIKNVNEINKFINEFSQKYAQSYQSLLVQKLVFGKNESEYGNMGQGFQKAQQHAQDAIKHLQNTQTSPADLKTLLDALKKLKPLQELALKKGSYTKNTKLENAGLDYTKRGSLIKCMKQVKKINSTVNQVLSAEDITKKLAKAAHILADRKVDKTIKTLLLNVHVDGKSLKDHLLLSDQKIKYGSKQIPFHAWIYNSALYGRSYEERGDGIKRVFELCKDNTNITPEKYAEFVEFLVSHKNVELDVKNINPKLLNKDSLQALLRSGRVTQKDVFARLEQYDIRTLQAQGKGRDGNAGPRIITSILNSKGSNAETVKGIIERTLATFDGLDQGHKESMEYATRFFAIDALKAKKLRATELDTLVSGGLIELDSVQEWARKGLLTKEILELEPKWIKMPDANIPNTILNFCIINDIKVGNERFSHWAERTHPGLMKDNKPLQDLEVKMLQDILNKKLYPENKFIEFKTQCEDAIAEGAAKDAATKREDGTVLNEIDLTKKAGVDALDVALLRTDAQIFARISNKLKSDTLKHIIDKENEIGVAYGAVNLHPILAASHVDFSAYPEDVLQSMTNVLQNTMVGQDGGVEFQSQAKAGGIPLLEYAQKAGYKFSTATFHPKLKLQTEIQSLELKIGQLQQERQEASERGTLDKVSQEWFENEIATLENKKASKIEEYNTKQKEQPKFVTAIQAILNTGDLVDVNAIAKMDIRTSDIINALNTQNKNIVSDILLKRVESRNLQTETVCELMVRSKSKNNSKFCKDMLQQFVSKISETGFAADPENAKITLEGYLKSGKLTPKDVIQNFAMFPIESMQAKARNGKTISEILMSDKKHKATASLLIQGAILNAQQRIESKFYTAEQMQEQMKQFFTDALKQDVLNSQDITNAFQSKLISLGTVEEWSKKGMLTEKVLAGQMVAGKDLQHYVIEKELKVGKQRIADWMDKKYFKSLDGEERVRDLEIKTLAAALKKAPEITHVQKELKSGIKAYVKKDLYEKDRKDTVLNDLAEKGEEKNSKVFTEALSVVTPSQFSALSTRLEAENLQFIVQNHIPIGPKGKHPLMVLENVNLYKNPDVKYIMDSLQTHRIDNHTGAVMSRRGGQHLLEYMHKNKFKFRSITDLKILGDAKRDVPELAKLYKQKEVFDKAFESTKGDKHKGSILKDAKADYKQLLSEIKTIESRILKTSPYTSKDPLEAVLASGYANTVELAKMDISAKDILSRMNAQNVDTVGEVLAQRVKDGKDVTKTMCTIVHHAMEHPKQIELLQKLDKACQKAMLKDDITLDTQSLESFKNTLNVCAVNKNVARVAMNKVYEQKPDSKYHANAEFTFHMLDLEAKCHHIKTMHYFAPKQKEFSVDTMRKWLDNMINALQYMGKEIKGIFGYKTEQTGTGDITKTVEKVASSASENVIGSMQLAITPEIASGKSAAGAARV